MNDHSLDFSVNKEVGIQLTGGQLQLIQRHQQRKPFEPQSNRDHSRAVNNRVDSHIPAKPATKPRSSASTSVARADQRAMLRRVLASKRNGSVARSTVSTSDDQKTYLRHMLTTSKSKDNRDTDSGASSASSAATSSQHVQDQKALLRKLLQKTKNEPSESRKPAVVLKENNRLEQKSTLAVVQMPTTRGHLSHCVVDDQETEKRKSALTNTLTTDYFEGRPAASKLPISDGYAVFLDVLKKEVAGDHTEVRCSVVSNRVLLWHNAHSLPHTC
jgi:hypothetical protein